MEIFESGREGVVVNVRMGVRRERRQRGDEAGEGWKGGIVDVQ